MVRPPSATGERVATWILLVGSVVLAAPILLVRYPPMGDLAMHEGTLAIARHLHDPAWVPPGHYYLVAPQANQLFFWAAYALSVAVPTDVACKVLVAAIVAATPLATARVLGRLGRSRMVALAIAPIASGWMLRWGLVANMTGFLALLLGLPELERLARRPRAAAAARASAWAALVFFAHESSAVVFAGIGAFFALVRWSSVRALLLRLSPAAVVGALAIVQERVSQDLVGASMRAIGSDFGPDPMDRLLILPGALFGGMGPRRLEWIGCVWLAALVASAVSGRGKGLGRAPLGLASWRHRYALLAAFLFLLYLVFPMSLGGTTLLAHRFLPPACACLVVACAGRMRATLGPERRGRWPRLAACVLAGAVPCVMVGVERHSFAGADADYRALDVVLAQLPRNVAVAQLDLTPKPAGHVAPVPGAAGRALAERGGRMLFAMTNTPPNPLYVTPGEAWDEPMQRLVMTPYAFMPGWDLRRFAFLLERNENPAARAAVARALAPEAELVAEAGHWSLFRSRLDVVPPNAPDAPLPSPAPETLGERISRAQAP
jgi:hypothetical protein